MGRPSSYTETFADEICRRIAEGETLKQICRDEDMPARSTVQKWVLDDVQGFSGKYARAREIQLESWAGVGLLLALAGAGLLAFGIFVWNQVGFGQLSYPGSLRIVIPAVTLIMLGMQIIFTSFLISMVSRAHA